MFTEFKHAVAAMTDHTGDNSALNLQLSQIHDRYPDNAPMISVVKQMQAVVRYLENHGEKAHADAIPVLHLLGEAVEALAAPETREDEVLAQCTTAFTGLKAKILPLPQVGAQDLEELKEVILAIDWEISETTLRQFDTVTGRLMTRLKPYRILYAFLKIINSMGRYIASRKAMAHKDAISFLRSVFENFERIIQTPDMPASEKKALVEQDIAAFARFKEKIASAAAEPVLPFHQRPGGAPGEELQIRPALSHVKAPRIHSDQKVVPLDRMPEGVPTWTDKRGAAAPRNRDIMGELFSPKETQTDQLLDAIHLSAVQGGAQETGMDGQDLAPKGFENITPRRMDMDPIPEIESRLDAFFNLDKFEDLRDDTATAEVEPSLLVPLPAYTMDDDDQPMVMDLEPIPEEPAPEALVLFQKGEDPVEDAIDRLQALAKGPFHPDAWIRMEDDMALLNELWQGDPDKKLLLDLVSWLARQVETEPADPLADDDPGKTRERRQDTPQDPDGTAVKNQEEPRQTSSGIWPRIKARLFSRKK